MPVETSVERGMQFGRGFHVPGARQNVGGFVGIFRVHSGQRELGKGRDLGIGQALADVRNLHGGLFLSRFRPLLSPCQTRCEGQADQSNTEHDGLEGSSEHGVIFSLRRVHEPLAFRILFWVRVRISIGQEVMTFEFSYC